MRPFPFFKALLAGCLLTAANSPAQNAYKYAVDLTSVTSDRLKVELTPPAITAKEITFYMPKIVPGTYMFSDYGKFIHEVKAYDKTGKELAVKQLDDNSWKILDASKLYRLSYDVEDTWDMAESNDVYSMSGSNIEEGKNFVLNPFAVFGYFEGMKTIPLELSFKKPAYFFASTPLKALHTDQATDVFKCDNLHELYDSPIMYCRPDTTSIQVANTKVMISVYSPKKMISSAFIAENMKTVLSASKDYLGGKLPVDHYSFIYYFNGEMPPFKHPGALEHSYSSFYSMMEMPQEKLIHSIIDVSSHEFFHIVTPLTIASKEIKDFDYNKPVLSKHLWLYEGSTEYYAHHMQVVSGLISPDEFLKRLSQKIAYSKKAFVDDLSFTELSKGCADQYKDQYGNVYMKGALISACLDLYLNQLSDGHYNLRALKHDLSVKYGTGSAFDDNELISEIARLTYPQIKTFFDDYVSGSKPLPYEYFFSLAGIAYKPSVSTNAFTLGGIIPSVNEAGHIFVASTAKLNEFGKKMGYLEGDELLSLNNETITPENFQELILKFYGTAKEGDEVNITAGRKNSQGVTEKMTLRGSALKIQKTEEHILKVMEHSTAKQLLTRNSWLGIKAEPTGSTQNITADPKDVSDINALVTTLYDVISGPAGDRNWNRFLSLFYPGAYMAAVAQTPNGKQMIRFSPEEYVKKNAPSFQKYDFTEKETGRVINRFGDIAQVFTSYQFTFATPKPMQEKGINSLQLVQENGRWWINSITWQEETADNPIPKAYLDKKSLKK